jgi:hypothetical protein
MTRTYSQVFNPEGKVVLSKWWMTASCRDAYNKEVRAKEERMAAARAAKAAARVEEVQAISGRLCADCKKVAVDYRKTYCGKCAHARHLKAKRESIRQKRGSGVDNPVFSPLQAEALTKQVLSDGYIDTPAQIKRLQLALN